VKEKGRCQQHSLYPHVFAAAVVAMVTLDSWIGVGEARPPPCLRHGVHWRMILEILGFVDSTVAAS
jgi:hypothetical protein